MASRLASFLLHASAASIMAYGYKSLGSLVMDSWIKTQYGGHFQFLTIQGLIMAWFTTVVALLFDVFPSVKSFWYIKRTLFMIAMPVAVVISSIYWTLILLLPSLIIQGPPSDSLSSTPGAPSSDPLAAFRIPLPMDLAMHAAPAITLLLDFILFEKSYTRKAVNYGAPVAAIAYTLWYTWWVERCASRNGSFPYPFLNNPFNVRVAIYIGAAALALGSFRGINTLRARLEGKASTSRRTANKNRKKNT